MNDREQMLKNKGYAAIDQPLGAVTSRWMDRVVIDGHVAYVSGHTCGDKASGKVPSAASQEQAKLGAEAAMAGLLRTLRNTIGSLDNVERVLRISGYVQSDHDYALVHEVVNGASDLLVDVFGETAGRHARTALGVEQLPGNASVEVEAIFILKK